MIRSQLLEAMTQLHLAGMRKAYDEIMAAVLKRSRKPQRILGGISEKRLRSVKYRMTTAKRLRSKELDEFAFDEASVRSLTSARRASGFGG